jgi:cysteine sulfinate desulfinase/cysteine desulfurase-like protein
MGTPKDVAVAAVRMSFGALNSMEQVPKIVATFADVVAKVRQLRAVLART